MSKKGLTVIVLLLLTGTGIWAQRDYRKGYIITNEHDTVYGWIDYRGDVRNSKICSFKETGNGRVTDYSPSDIAAYRYIDSKYYVSRNVGNAGVPKQVFLEYLVNGLAKLYYFRDDNTNEHYYIEKDQRFIELKIDEKEVEVDGKTQIKTVKSYIGMLKATLNVWEMNSVIDKAKLEHSSLIDIAKDYHHYACTDGSECIVYEKKKPLMALRFAPVAGVDLSTVKMMSGSNDEKYEFDPSTNFTVGVNLNLSMPRFNEKFFLQMQAMYTKYYFFAAYDSPQKIIHRDVHVRSNVLQFGLALKYEYPKGKWRPTLAAGAAAVYLPDGAVEEVTDTYHYSDVVRTSTNKYDFPTRFMYGFEVVPGVHYYLTKERIIFIQLQYLRSFQHQYANSPANVIQSFGLSAGIYF